MASAHGFVALLYQVEGNRVPGNLKSKTLRWRLCGSGLHVERVGAIDDDEALLIAYDRKGEGVRAAWTDEIVNR